MLHSGIADLGTTASAEKCYLIFVNIMEFQMFRQFFRNLAVARQSAAAHEALRYLSDSQLKALGCTPENFVRKAEERLMNEFTSKDATTNSAVPVNPNLVGAV